MKVLIVLVALVVITCAMWWPIALRLRRKGLVKVGAGLVPSSQVVLLYHHDLKATLLIERLLQQDRTIPILNDEDRVEAERLVKAFYDDKGD